MLCFVFFEDHSNIPRKENIQEPQLPDCEGNPFIFGFWFTTLIMILAGFVELTGFVCNAPAKHTS